MTAPEPVVHVLLDTPGGPGSLAAEVRRGLGGRPLRMRPAWLYDDRGSELFDRITRLEEYYPFRAEREILRNRAPEIAAACDATTLVELGSGTSEKTRLLLDAFHREGHLRRFVPVDVSEATLREAATTLHAAYPDVAVEAVVGDFTLHLARLPRGDRRMVAFLGGTIGNLDPTERAAFLRALHESLDPGEWLLLGTDLVKDLDRLVAAYDDGEGLTAAFVTNALHVLNRELGADFDAGAFRYVAFWDPTLERMDLRLRAEGPQRVRVPGAGLDLDIADDEEIRVEISSKFRPEGLRAELGAAGFDVADAWTDARGDFALTLARRR